MENIEGVLTVNDKIWFNSNMGKCRLRICGFTKEQIKDMEKSSFIDITLTDNKDNKVVAYMLINRKEKEGR